MEAAKPYSVEGLSRYLSKLNQAVSGKWKRRVSFSEWWPIVPREGLPRKGKIEWRPVKDEKRSIAESEMETMIEVLPGEYAVPGKEFCCCFEFKDFEDRRAPPEDEGLVAKAWWRAGCSRWRGAANLKRRGSQLGLF